jgi:glycerol kinase
MRRSELILAIDQGSSSTKALLVSRSGAVLAEATAPVGQSFPQPGWVEQSAVEIVDSVRQAVSDCLSEHDPAEVVAVGLSNQRESLLLWERDTCAPVSPLISWQDQRGAASCAALLQAGRGPLVRNSTGLPLDPMFSATRAQWLLDHFDPDRTRSQAGQLCLGTVDSWLLNVLCGSHLMEVGNASRTQLLDVRSRSWNPALLDVFGVPIEVLPEVVPSIGPFPPIRGLPPLPDGTPITAVLGDSHSALFAHAGWLPGHIKATYGTGSSVMGLCPQSTDVGDGLCLTIAWDDGEPAYAFEGNIRSSGATLSWLARTAERTPAELAELAAGAESDGVRIVPAFGGLGAPWWDSSATALISGLTFGAGLPQLARAALESIAFQIEDVISAAEKVIGPIDTLLADGAPTSNPHLMQLQADISGRGVARAETQALSALGAAHLAGRAAGIWTDADLLDLPRQRTVFVHRLPDDARAMLRNDWAIAVRRARFSGE